MESAVTSQSFVLVATYFSRRLVAVALLLCCLVANFASAQDPEGASPASPHQEIVVGQVSMVLGKAHLLSGGRTRTEIRAGSTVSERDQIVTAANGHVHIRFIDEALVSVRPNSRLEIQRYDYNPVDPRLSAVKFNLHEGVTRSISGAAAKSARERFRLNTPIAAIGVRGTDFVVSTTDQVVRAVVNEGAIVMAPFSAECRADGFGPCAEDAMALAADTFQVLELNLGTPLATPTLVEREDGKLREEVELILGQQESADDFYDAEESVKTEVYQESVTSPTIAAEAGRLASELARLSTPPAPQQGTVPNFMPAAPLATDALLARQLVWGRWSEGQTLGDLERITVPYPVASAGRAITVGNFIYGLFRVEEDPRLEVQAGPGVVGFRLNSAQAVFNSATGIAALQVTGGSLDIDFDRRQFATTLSLRNAATAGLFGFSAAGNIYPGGYFYTSSDAKNVFGAVSMDGSEAGYYFREELADGAIQGLTTWGAP